jgi:hypothetical protein
VSSLKDPVCIFGVSNDSIIPFDDKMPRSWFEQGRARKVVHIQLRFRKHIDASSEILWMTCYSKGKVWRLCMHLYVGFDAGEDAHEGIEKQD